jgi:hypothetical protein
MQMTLRFLTLVIVTVAVAVLVAANAESATSSLQWYLRPSTDYPLSQPQAENYCASLRPPNGQRAVLPPRAAFEALRMALYNGDPSALDLPDGLYWTSEKHAAGISVEYDAHDRAFGSTSLAHRNSVVCLVQ